MLLVSSCVLYVLSLTLYEVTAALIAGAGLIYLLARLPLRAVWRKWAADLVVTAIIVWGFILGHWVPHQPGVNLPHGGNYLHDRLLLFRDQGLDLARDSTRSCAGGRRCWSSSSRWQSASPPAWWPDGAVRRAAWAATTARSC